MAAVSVQKQATMILDRAQLDPSDDLFIPTDKARAVLTTLRTDHAKTDAARNAIDKALEALAPVVEQVEIIDPLAALLNAAVVDVQPAVQVAAPVVVKLAPQAATPIAVGSGVSILSAATYKDKAQKDQKYSGGPSMRVFFEGQRAFLTIKGTQLEALISVMRDDKAVAAMRADIANAQTNWNALA